MEIDVILDSQGLFVEVTYQQLLTDGKDPDSLDVGRMSNTKVLRTVGSRTEARLPDGSGQGKEDNFLWVLTGSWCCPKAPTPKSTN